jgi:hypothetical protein
VQESANGGYAEYSTVKRKQRLCDVVEGFWLDEASQDSEDRRRQLQFTQSLCRFGAMPPSCFSPVPDFAMRDAAGFPFMNFCDVLPTALAPPAADPATVHRLVEHMSSSSEMPTEHLEAVAAALAQGIMAALALGGARQQLASRTQQRRVLA